MMRRNPQPVHRLKNFLAQHGLCLEDAGAYEKILFLESLIDHEPAPTFCALTSIAQKLKTIGRGSPQEVMDQHGLILAYLRNLRRDRRLRTPAIPSPAMPAAVLWEILASLDTDLLLQQRTHTLLLLVWWSGLPEAILRRIRRSWVSPVAGEGLLLRCPRLYSDRVDRQLAVPYSSNPAHCAVRSLERWFTVTHIPDDPSAYVFPATARNRILDWKTAFPKTASMIRQQLAYELSQIGETKAGYNVTSLRRAHALRCRKHLGSGLALQRAGFSHHRSLDWMLRAEPNWTEVHNGVL